MPTSTPTIAKVTVWALWASNGLDIVSLFYESLLSIYTNLDFSTAPIIIALPFGSTAKYSPGTILLQPVLPKVS